MRLEGKYEDRGVRVVQSNDASHPFEDAEGHVWRYAYVVEPATGDHGNNPVKQAFMDGHIIQRRYGDGRWEEMHEASYFDLPGYEYKVDNPEPESNWVTNKELAEWLIRGRGLLIDVESRLICTSYNFSADEAYCEVPSRYKIMPIGSADWLEPTYQYIDQLEEEDAYV